jgi:hypothetical protein
VTGVSGLTQSTPLCITSLTFMADLHYWISGALDATQHGPTFSTIHTTDRVRAHLSAQNKASFLRDRIRGTPPDPTATSRTGFPPSIG